MKTVFAVGLFALGATSAAHAQSYGDSFSSTPEEVRNLRAGVFVGFGSIGDTDTRNSLLTLSGLGNIAPNLTFQGDLDLAHSLTETPSGDFDWSLAAFRGALQYEIRPGLSFGPSLGVVKVDSADEAVFNYGVNALYAPADTTQIEVGLDKREDDDGVFAYAVVDYSLSSHSAFEAYIGHYFDGDSSFDGDYTEYRAGIEYGFGNGLELYGALSGISYTNDTFNDLTVGASYEVARGTEAYIGATTSLDGDTDNTTFILGLEIDFGQVGGADSYGDRGRLSYGDDDYAVGVSRRF